MCSIDYIHHDDYLSYVYVGSMPNSRMSNEDHLGLLLSGALFGDQRPASVVRVYVLTL